jgi:hypothetical protein
MVLSWRYTKRPERLPCTPWALAKNGPKLQRSAPDTILDANLEAEKGPVEFLIIDHAEKPSEN